MMKKRLLLLSFLWFSVLQAQDDSNYDYAYGPGEWFRFRVHYGLINAGYATLEVKEGNIEGKSVNHVIGKGRTTGLAKLFFKVEDKYETYIDKENGRPYRFIRKIDEGGYTKDVEINFDYNKKTALYHNKKKNKKVNLPIHDEIQDMVSTFYYLRNQVDISKLKKGDEFTLDMMYDEDETFKFRLKYLGKDIIRTKFGKIECLKFRPFVQSGRVFKEKESLTIWVSNDQNKIPLRIKASLAVGNLKADLNAYKGLKHQFKILVK